MVDIELAELNVVNILRDWEDKLMDFVMHPEEDRYVFGPFIWDQIDEETRYGSHWARYLKFKSGFDADRFLSHANVLTILMSFEWELIVAKDTSGRDPEEMVYEQYYVMRRYKDRLRSLRQAYEKQL